MSFKQFFQKAFKLAKWLVIPGDYDELDPNDIITRRKRKTRYVILGAALLFIFMTMGAILLQDSGVDAPISNDIAVALILNLNLILLVVMILLVLRNVVKLYFERRGGIAGSRFQTKLIIAFLALTLIPSALMFAVAYELIGDTVDKWINSRIEHTLQESLQVAENLYRTSEEETNSSAYYLSGLMERRGMATDNQKNSLSLLLRQKVREYNVNFIQVYNSDFEIITQAFAPGAEQFAFDIKARGDLLAKVALGEAASVIEDDAKRTIVISVAPIPRKIKSGQIRGIVVVVKEVSKRLIEKVHGIVAAFEDYKQLSLKKEVIKASYRVTLTLVALVIVFSAIWFGFYLAKGITVPLRMLSEATERVAKGDLDVRIDLPEKDDEVGQLVKAFNSMTRDLKSSQEQIERSNRELSDSNLELYHWGQYIEAVLEHVGGVISIDKAGAITTINDSAARMFGVQPNEARGVNYKKLLQFSQLDPIRRIIRDMSKEGVRTKEEEIILNVNGSKRTLKTNVSILTDHSGAYMGMVLVFDDVTDLISAQRTMAWREMARSIAHEIKNPLTPIQLNAQRMRRKYEQKSEDFPKVLDDATNIIIQEVDQLKSLVGKFSKFSQQSEAEIIGSDSPGADELKMRPEPNMLHDIIFEIVKLYKDTRQGVSIITELDPSVQLVNIDAEQIRRVIINLVENAIDAVGAGGEITIRTRAMAMEGKVVLEVADTGQGVSEQFREKIFQPYFSTKENGTGLGLAIISRVIEDHGGRISLKDNEPEGAVFTIELAVD